ncbi:MAG: hypothetical protein AABY95_09725 [Pseudomonadota bacterium]
MSAKLLKKKGNHYDVTGTVLIAYPQDVCDAISQLLQARYPGCDLTPLQQAFMTFTRLYTGELPGYLGNDTWYHDAQHSLDCALAMTRLLDGHDSMVTPEQHLGQRRALLGVIAALFHDAGYIRKRDDVETHGAEFTLNHVSRSGDFLAAFLPDIGFAGDVAMARQLVHFTGYEIALDKIQVHDPLDRKLGFLLGTADMLAQFSDRCYLEKCRDFLFPEFEICGLAGAPRDTGPKPMYATAEDLLRKTPEFNRKIWAERLDGYFEGAYRYMQFHFGGHNPYLEACQAHLALLKWLLKSDRLGELRRRPEAINTPRLRKLLGLTGKVLNFPTPKRALAMPHRKHSVDVVEQQRHVPA